MSAYNSENKRITQQDHTCFLQLIKLLKRKHALITGELLPKPTDQCHFLLLHTNLVVLEVNTLPEDDWHIPFVHTVVFLIHPFVENIRVQNPTSMDLENTHAHTPTHTN